MNEKKHYLSQNVIETLEKSFYQDINQSTIWNPLFEKSLEQNDDFSKKIEEIAANGLSNLQELYSFCFTNFWTARKLFIKETIPFNDDFMGFYLSLLIYFSNCYSRSSQKTLYEMTKEEIQYFFKEDAVTAILSMIAKEHTKELSLLQQSDNIEALRLLLLLPYHLNEEFLDTRKFKNPLEIGHQLTHQAIQNNEALFNITVTLYLYFLLSKLFLLCGSHKFFGFYQRLIDSESGNALYSIPYQNQMFLLKSTSTLVAGVANIDTIQFLKNGSLLLILRHGMFSDDLSTNQAGFNTALAISEYLHDTLYLFNVFTDKRGLQSDFVYHILIETPQDNPHFIDIVLDQISHMYSELKNMIKVIPSLTEATQAERERYLNTDEVQISEAFMKEISEKLTTAGHKTTLLIPKAGFEGIKIIDLKPQEILFNENDSSVFVYIPFNDGLKGTSLKSHMEFTPKAWAPIGHIGILQNDVRTATIQALKPVKLLMIPGSLYLRYWHADYSMEELRSRIIRSP